MSGIPFIASHTNTILLYLASPPVFRPVGQFITSVMLLCLTLVCFLVGACARASHPPCPPHTPPAFARIVVCKYALVTLTTLNTRAQVLYALLYSLPASYGLGPGIVLLNYMV